MQVNTQTFVEIKIEEQQLRDDDATLGGVVLKMTEREAKQLAKDLAEVTRKKK